MNMLKKWQLFLLVILLVMFVFPISVFATQHGDYTNDNKIGSQDALYLLRHVLNPGSYPVKSTSLGGHVYDHRWDADCNLCGDTRTVQHIYNAQWVSDQKEHWKECSGCQDRKEVAPHIPGPSATADEPQICTVCEKILASATNHIHSYPDDWKHDEAGHWHECQCGSVQDLSVHSWGKKECVKEATDKEEGIMRTYCEICSGQKDDVIPKFTGSVSPTENIAIALPVLAVLLGFSIVGNAVLVVVVIKSKKK